MRWSLSSACAPASSTVTSDRAPSISNWTGTDSRRSRLSLAIDSQRDQELGRVAGFLPAHVGHRAPTGCRARSGDRRADGSAPPAAARQTHREAPASGRCRRSSRSRGCRNRSRSRCGPPCWPSRSRAPPAASPAGRPTHSPATRRASSSRSSIFSSSRGLLVVLSIKTQRAEPSVSSVRDQLPHAGLELRPARIGPDLLHAGRAVEQRRSSCRPGRRPSAPASRPRAAG